MSRLSRGGAAIRRAAPMIAAGVLAVAWPARASPPVVNLSGPNSQHEAEVCIAVSPLDHAIMAVAGHGGPAGIAVWYTTDGWRTWEMTPITEAIDGYPHSRSDPSCAFAPDGSLYVAYILLDARTCGADFSGRSIACLRREGPDSGYHPMNVVYEGCGCDKPFVAAGPSPGGGPGYSVYVAFDVASARILVAASEGDHEQFGPPTPVGGAGSFAVPAVTSSGDLFVVWHEAPDDPAAGTIRVARSVSGGGGFDPSVVIAYPEVKRKQTIPAAPGRGMHAGPSIAVGSDDELYVAYTTASQLLNWEDADVVFCRAEDPAGLTWSRPRLVHRSNAYAQFFPWITVDAASGALAVFYLDARDGDNKVVEPWISVSTDGGTNWRERKFVSVPTDESCKGCQDPPRCTRRFTNYLEYNGVVMADGIITGVWAGNPDTTGCVVPGVGTPPSSDLDLLLHAMAIDSLYTPRARRVPQEYASISQAMGAAAPGDTVLVSGSEGPLCGSFDLSSNILVLPEPGTGRPVLTAAGLDHVVRVPTRCTAALRGFEFRDYVDAAIDVRVADTSSPTVIEIVDCKFYGGLHGVTTADAVVRIRDCEFVGQTAEAVLGNSVAGSAYGERRLVLDNLFVVDAHQGVGSGSTPLHIAGSVFADVESVGVSARGSKVDSLIVTGTSISLAPQGTAALVAARIGTSSLVPCRIESSLFSGGRTGIELSGVDLQGVECRVTGQTAWGIAATQSRLGVDSCRLDSESAGGIRLTSGVMDLSGSQVDLDANSPAACIELNECKRLGPLKATRIRGSTLTGGKTGLLAVDSYVAMDSLVVEGQGRNGILVTFADTEDTLHTAIRRSTVHTGAPDAVYGISVTAAESDSVTAVISGNTVDGWGTGIYLLATKGLILPASGQVGMEPVREGLFHPILTGNMVSLRQGEGGGRTGIDATKATPARFECNNAYLVGGGVPYLPARSQGESNYTYSPQYCGAESGDFRLRITSPGAPGNLCEGGIGAWGVACAADTLAFEWEEGPDTVRVAPGTRLCILSDVIVPAGSTLLLREGVELCFDALDDSSKGADPMKNELTVRGRLFARGREGEVVAFRSGRESPAEADWAGIRVEPGGSLEIEHGEVRHAECGIAYGSDLPGRVANTLFAGNRDRDILAGSGADSCGLAIDDNVFQVGGGTAIGLTGGVDGVTVSGNALVGDDRSLVGIELGPIAEEARPLLVHNRITGFRAGTGIRMAGAGARPKVRMNALRGNDRGVGIQGGAIPDLGVSALDPGNNAIEAVEPGQVCVANENPDGVPPVLAEGNYFGACVDCRPSRCWIGNVVATYWLCEDPTVGSAPPPDDPGRKACGMWIVRTFPNPTPEGARVAFILEGGGGSVGVDVFDLRGRKVRSLKGVEFGPGEHELAWDGRDSVGNAVPSGVYFLRLAANGRLDTSARVTVVR